MYEYCIVCVSLELNYAMGLIIYGAAKPWIYGSATVAPLLEGRYALAAVVDSEK